jgi:hypothetical protein
MQGALKKPALIEVGKFSLAEINEDVAMYAIYEVTPKGSIVQGKGVTPEEAVADSGIDPDEIDFHPGPELVIGQPVCLPSNDSRIQL